MTKALLVEENKEPQHVTVESGIAGIKEYFLGQGDLNGRTIQKLDDDTYVRIWSACNDRAATRALVDAYRIDGKRFQVVDLPDEVAARIKSNGESITI